MSQQSAATPARSRGGGGVLPTRMQPKSESDEPPQLKQLNTLLAIIQKDQHSVKLAIIVMTAMSVLFVVGILFSGYWFAYNTTTGSNTSGIMDHVNTITDPQGKLMPPVTKLMGTVSTAVTQEMIVGFVNSTSNIMEMLLSNTTNVAGAVQNAIKLMMDFHEFAQTISDRGGIPIDVQLFIPLHKKGESYTPTPPPPPLPPSTLDPIPPPPPPPPPSPPSPISTAVPGGSKRIHPLPRP